MTHPLTTTRPLAAGFAALALVVGLGLSGCSLGGESASPEAAGGGTTQPSSGASTEPSTGASSEPGESASSGSDEAAGKPSQEEVAAGLSKVIAEMAPGASEASQDVLDKMTTCAVGKIYDTASEDSLQAMAEGNLSGADADDLTALSNAISECSTELMGG